MTEHKASEITGGDPLFTVTKDGIAAMKDESPKPPKVTRSQQRMADYRDFADAYDCTFRDFLKIQSTDWYKNLKAGNTPASILEDYL
jgi:inorganic pyrophosphatase